MAFLRVGWLKSPLEMSFGWSDGTEPCAVLIDWNTHSVAPDGGD